MECRSSAGRAMDRYSMCVIEPYVLLYRSSTVMHACMKERSVRVARYMPAGCLLVTDEGWTAGTVAVACIMCCAGAPGVG
jgi:hypothetical protein